MSAESVTDRVTLSRRCAAPRCSRRLTGRGHAATCSPACRVRLHRWRKARRGLPGARGQPGASRAGDDWHTPPWLVEAARAAMGGSIGLDPASCPEAQRTVRAEVWYGPGSPHGEDGLAAAWPPLAVFCNPPYGRGRGGSTKRDWTHRLARHWYAHQVPIVAVLPGDPSAAWADPIHWTAPAMAVATRRVRFLPGGDGSKARDPALGTLVGLWGCDLDAFRERLAATPEGRENVLTVWNRERGAWRL